MTVHLLNPGPVSFGLRLRCGMRVEDAVDDDMLGTEDNVTGIDCVGCLHDLIAEMRLAGIGEDTPETRWLVGGDTGTSSLTIWSVMTGRPMPNQRWPSVPHDPDDFGRCHRLLETFPHWRERLSEVARRHPDWIDLVRHWDELTQMYLSELPTGNAPKTWARMREIQGS